MQKRRHHMVLRRRIERITFWAVPYLFLLSGYKNTIKILRSLGYKDNPPRAKSQEPATTATLSDFDLLVE